MSKNVVAKTWSILPSFDGLLYSQYPLGDKPVPAPTGGPKIAFTDIVAGPTSGGEFNRGAYLSIFGWGFGTQAGLGVTTKVYIGGVEVDNYRALNPARTFARNGLQRIIVQVGAIGGAAAGSVNAIKVTVGGVDSNTDKTFTVQPGRFWFVNNATGNDATGKPDDITKPFRYAQFWTGPGATQFSGIWGATTASGDAGLRAGDTIVLHGGTTYQDQTGYDGRFLRFRSHTGTAPNGVSGNGYIHITRYPGKILLHAPDDVYFKDPSGGRGFIQGVNSAFGFPNNPAWGRYVTVSGFRIELVANSVADSGGVEFQYGADNWRACDCEIGPWPNDGVINPTTGGMSGQGNGIFTAGNYIHDIDGKPANQETHGYYFDLNNNATPAAPSVNIEICYNWIKNMNGGSGIQFFDTFFAGSSSGNKIHHNFIETWVKYGINLADGTQSADVWDNIVTSTTKGRNAFRMTALAGTPAFNITHNTFHQASSSSGSPYEFLAEGTFNTGTIKAHHNIFAIGTGAGLGGYLSFTGSAFSFDQNLYYDFNGINTAPGSDTHSVFGNPLFTSVSGLDFTVLTASPALAACTTAEVIAVPDAYLGTARPVTTTAAPGATKNDIGAMQGAGT